MFKLIYTNSRKQSIEMFGHPFRLTRVEGLGGTDVDVQTQKSPYQDGTTYIDSVLNDKPIEIEFRITGQSQLEVDTSRRYVSSVFNPKLGLGTLRYIGEGMIREIGVVVEAVPFFPDGRTNRGRTFQKALINLKAPNPYWQSIEQITEPLAAFMPRFRFPFQFDVQFGERGSEATLYNDGDVPCPIQLEFTGPAFYPVVTNRTTGEFIRIRRELNEGDKLIINTSDGQDKAVVIQKQNGDIENAWHYIDIWESTLFKLDVGTNILDYDAISGQGLVTISYKNQHVGV